jgi:NAD(P)-dependent dehydrogenase (short-subunit alcohol dehydrogenase family)
MTKTWFVTGASRGLGAQIAKAALAAGHNVVATGRDAAALKAALGPDDARLLHLALDVTDSAQAVAAARAAEERFGAVDVLVNNAGYGLMGYFEETSAEDAQAQFDTNLFGMMNVCRAILPGMRRAKAGLIFNISSIAGFRGIPGGSLLCASKHAVEGFSEALAREVEPFGIFVTLVEPGIFRTGFLSPQSLRFAGQPVADYAQASEALRQAYRARDGKQPGDPAKLGAALVRLAQEAKPPTRFLAGPDAVQLMEARIASLGAELEAWRALSVSTDAPA